MLEAECTTQMRGMLQMCLCHPVLQPQLLSGPDAAPLHRRCSSSMQVHHAEAVVPALRRLRCLWRVAADRPDTLKGWTASLRAAWCMSMMHILMGSKIGSWRGQHTVLILPGMCQASGAPLYTAITLMMPLIRGSYLDTATQLACHLSTDTAQPTAAHQCQSCVSRDVLTTVMRKAPAGYVQQ